jgi:uncharacterized DUF497 family protein
MPPITFDPNKRLATLRARGMDFDDAARVFEGRKLEWVDDRFDYGETRIVTAGWLADRLVILVWTPRGDMRHVISMRRANARERARLEKQFGKD